MVISECVNKEHFKSPLMIMEINDCDKSMSSDVDDQQKCAPPCAEFEDDERLVSLPIPEVIEMLKNLAACNEKLHKWEQSTSKLERIPENDPNKKQLMEIIDFVNQKTSNREKAIYLYQQLGRKCHQHGNYIGAAKAFERAAGLLMDVTDQSDVNNIDEETIMATIRCLESAIHNYDAIHKYKHAGTLHYRCSRILRLMTNASREQVEQHHIKALEYFTKPDHELKQRKRIDGLKISCYSSCSTWARMTSSSLKSSYTTRKMKNQKMTTTTHHKTITTTNHMINFHRGDEEESELEDLVGVDSEDEISNNKNKPKTSTTLNPTTSSIDDIFSRMIEIRNSSPSSPKSSFEFSQENNHSYGQEILESETSPDYLEKYIDAINDVRSIARPETSMKKNDDYDGTTTMIFNESMPATPTTPSSLASSIQEVPKTLKQSQQQRQSCNSSPVSVSKYHKENNHSYHHHIESSKFHNHQERYLHRQSLYSSFHHSSKQHKMYSSPLNHHRSDYHHHHYQKSSSTIFRCIEDRIESARKLVKKLHKLCPFYEVSTSGGDVGRVYCRICDRYLGAVSSTLKNHVNTQEHRQAYEDSLQQQSTTMSGTQSSSLTQQQQILSVGQPLIPVQALTTNSQSVPLIAYPGQQQERIMPNVIGQQQPQSSTMTNSQEVSAAVPQQQQQQMNYINDITTNVPPSSSHQFRSNLTSSTTSLIPVTSPNNHPSLHLQSWPSSSHHYQIDDGNSNKSQTKVNTLNSQHYQQQQQLYNSVLVNSSNHHHHSMIQFGTSSSPTSTTTTKIKSQVRQPSMIMTLGGRLNNNEYQHHHQQQQYYGITTNGL